MSFIDLAVPFVAQGSLQDSIIESVRDSLRPPYQNRDVSLVGPIYEDGSFNCFVIGNGNDRIVLVGQPSGRAPEGHILFSCREEVESIFQSSGSKILRFKTSRYETEEDLLSD